MPIWHLPCHLVFQKGKYRFCHDGRAPTGGLCLNELLINDLNLMTPLLDPINNLRRFLYAFSTDIEAFFHNIAVDERDRGVFRFLWYEDEKMEVLKTYLMLFMVFGSSSSPSITSYILKIHGERVREKFGEEIYLIITRFFYVDDGSGGANSVEKCRKLARDLKAAMLEGGFELGKWKFSHPALRGDDEEEEQDEEASILGIR